MQPSKPPCPPDAKNRVAPHAARNVLFVLVGVGGLVLKGRYSGPACDLVHSYGGNVAASFAVYFWAMLATGPVAAWSLAQRARRGQRLGSNLPRVLAAGVAMVVVQLFELFDGFGVMTNVHDHFDLVANTAGIAIAFAIDASCAAGPAGDRPGSKRRQRPRAVKD